MDTRESVSLCGPQRWFPAPEAAPRGGQMMRHKAGDAIPPRSGRRGGGGVSLQSAPAPSDATRGDAVALRSAGIRAGARVSPIVRGYHNVSLRRGGRLMARSRLAASRRRRPARGKNLELQWLPHYHPPAAASIRERTGGRSSK